MTEKDSKPSWMVDLGMFAVIIGDVIGYTGAGVFLGWLAWKKLGWPWWTLLVTSLGGLALAFYRIYRMSRILNGK